MCVCVCVCVYIYTRDILFVRNCSKSGQKGIRGKGNVLRARICHVTMVCVGRQAKSEAAGVL